VAPGGVVTPLRVGLNLVPIAEDGGGIARYAVELVAALAERDDLELHLFTAWDVPASLRAVTGAARVTRLPRGGSTSSTRRPMRAPCESPACAP
jgi:hypothetical protein